MCAFTVVSVMLIWDTCTIFPIFPSLTWLSSISASQLQPFIDSNRIKPNLVEPVMNGLAGVPAALTDLASGKQVSGKKLVATVAWYTVVLLKTILCNLSMPKLFVRTVECACRKKKKKKKKQIPQKQSKKAPPKKISYIFTNIQKPIRPVSIWKRLMKGGPGSQVL